MTVLDEVLRRQSLFDPALTGLGTHQADRSYSNKEG